MSGLQLHWTVTPPSGRTLFVLFGYHGRDRDTEPSSWLDRIGGPNARGHRIDHRDHYANPRTLPYQVAMIAAAIERLTPDAAADLVIDSALGPDAARELAGGFGRIEVVDLVQPRMWKHNLATRSRDYDNVVLIYADALGLGCEEAERRMVRESGRVLAINGRRRAFVVDAGFSARMDLHRWLARTRIVERLLAVAVRPFAGVLGFLDRAAGRSA